MQDAHDFSVVLDAHVPLIVVETHDEQRAVDMMQRVARRQARLLYVWTVSDGLKSGDFGLELARENPLLEPEAVLRHIKDEGKAGIYMLCDFHPWLEDYPTHVRLLKDIALANQSGRKTVVLVSHELNLPPELARYSARFGMSLPDQEQITALVREEARKWSERQHDRRKVKANRENLNKLVANLSGLTVGEVRRLARAAIVDDGAITENDLPEINRAKFQLLDMDGVLSFEYDTEHFSDVGGMENLKHWLNLRREIFLKSDNVGHVDPPKGLLLLGVQGGGKSLAAKAVAGLWGVPLLRLDVGSLYNKFHGETERNLRESLALADRMSPCVLWVDELEKGLAPGSGEESGVSRRVLGTLLTWMAERQSQVFMVATSNDIAQLPPELMRKGRFDEIFFVDLPEKDVREKIFVIHLRKRGLEPSNFDCRKLADISEGFSGAEIEQAVVASFYSAQNDRSNLTTATVVRELAATAPLSAVMSESLTALRQWAAERQLLTA